MKLDLVSGISVTAINRPQDVLTLNNGKSQLSFGALKEISGWVSVIDPGIIDASLIGKTLKLEVKLTVASLDILPAHPECAVLSLIGNSSDLVLHSFKEDTDDPFMKGVGEILSEEIKEGHRFTGFMENPKDL